jgi:multiple antibiotic resistance protein
MVEFFICFMALFVAVDPIGILPLFMSLTQDVKPLKLRKIIIQSIATALVVSLVFLFAGKFILRYLGVSVGDFMIAGGALLFIFSISDLLTVEKKELVHDPDSVGAVPIGVPIVAGPALFTTMIILVGQHGYIVTVAATVLTLLLTAGVFILSRKIYTFLGHNGSKTVSKLASLLLAAIAVMMIRKGLITVLTESGILQ